VFKLGIITCFGLGGWNVANRFEQASMVEPVDPFQRGELDGFQASPRAASPDHLGLVEAVDRLGQGVVVTVADAADRRLDAGAPVVARRTGPQTLIALSRESSAPICSSMI
jgi:hypothetical protein